MFVFIATFLLNEVTFIGNINDRMYLTQEKFFQHLCDVVYIGAIF